MSNEAHEQVDKEETGESKDFKRLLSHEVRDKNINDSAENLDGDISHNKTDEVSTNGVPAVKVFALNYRQF